MRRRDREETRREEIINIIAAADCCRLGLIDDDGLAYSYCALVFKPLPKTRKPTTRKQRKKQSTTDYLKTRRKKRHVALSLPCIK